MVNNTKVNDIQESFLQSIEIVTDKLLQGLSYDKTIVCTITDDSKKENNEYTVSDGSVSFKAYSATDVKYKKDESVYVNVPEGNFTNDKFIIGKKTNSEQKVYNYKEPFDQIIDLSGNLVESINDVRLIANGDFVILKGKRQWIYDEDTQNSVDSVNKNISIKLKNGFEVNTENNCIIQYRDKEYPGSYYVQTGLFTGEYQLDEDIVSEPRQDSVHIATIDLSDVPIQQMTWLGVKAKFKTLLSQAISGSYGLALKLSPEPLQKDSGIFDCSEFFGNPYNFIAYQEQQKLFSINNSEPITKIEIYLYQKNDFYYIDREDNNTKKLIEAQEAANIFVDELYVCYGKDSNEITEDIAELIPLEGTAYEKSGETKNMKLRWIHKDGDKAYIVKANEHSELLKDYDIQWYRFALGAPAPDDWAGIYWQKIAAASESAEDQLIRSFETGDGNLEQIKVIVFSKGEQYSTNADDKYVHIRSNVLDYVKEQSKQIELSKDFSSALIIECDDGTNGNYPFYNQHGDLFDITQDDKIRTLSTKISIDGVNYKTPTLSPGEDKNLIGVQSIEWIFPQSNSMIVDAKYCDTMNLYLKTNDEDQDITSSVKQLKDKNNINQYYYNDNLIHIIDYKLYNNQPFGYQEKVTNDDGEEITKYWTYGNEEKDITDEINEKHTYNNREYYINNNNLFYKDEQTDNNHIGFCNISLNPTYRIAQRYSESATNNTIICKIKYADKIYTGIKEFTFTPQGTMGTKYTMLVDFVDGKNAININHDEITDDKLEYYKLKLQVYDGLTELDTSKTSYTWTIMNNPFGYEKDGKYYLNNKTQIALIGTGAGKEYNSMPVIIKDQKLYYAYFLTYDETNEKWDSSFEVTGNIVTLNPIFFKSMDNLWIVKVKDSTGMTTYFPIALCNGDEYLAINGPKRVIYGSDGKPYYSNEDYLLYYLDKVTDNIKAMRTLTEIYPKGSNEASITGTQANKLQPSVLYAKEAPLYGVQFKLNTDTILWTQPILVIQNTYPSTTVNSWDGKTLTLDNENGTILGTALAMGTKNRENQFTGVMLGDWSPDGDQSLAKSGLYGFNGGKQVFAFKEDGTAFIGPGDGRINFDGTKATIYGEKIDIIKEVLNSIEVKYKYHNSMIIDLNDLEINMEKTQYKNDKENETKQLNIGFSGYNPYISLNGYSSKSIYPLQVGSDFKVDWNGTVTADSGNFSGNITATSGKIGDWTIVNKITDGIYYNQLKTSNNEIVLDAENKQITVGTGGSIIANGGSIEADRLISGTSSIILQSEWKTYNNMTATDDLIVFRPAIENSDNTIGTITSYVGKFGFNGTNGQFRWWTQEGGDTYDPNSSDTGYKMYIYLETTGLFIGHQDWNGTEKIWERADYNIDFNGATLTNCTIEGLDLSNVAVFG